MPGKITAEDIRELRDRAKAHTDDALQMFLASILTTVLTSIQDGTIEELSTITMEHSRRQLHSPYWNRN